MQTIFDYFFSSVLLMLIFFILSVLICAVILFKIKFKSNNTKRLLWIICIIYIVLLFIFFVFINPGLLGYGFAKNFNFISSDQNYICFIDSYTTGDDSPNTFRLHVIDHITGKRLYKKIIGNNIYQIIQKNNLLLCKKSYDYVLYDLKTGSIKNIFNIETFPIIFNEYFGKGIASFSYDDNREVFLILAKTGYKYTVDPFTMKISDKDIEEYKKNYNDEYYSDNYTIRKNDKYNSVIISLSSKDWNDKIKIITKEGGDKTNNLPGFLDAVILNVFNNNSFLVLSYETTDKKNFILTCISFDLNVLWRISQADLKTKDFINKKPAFNVSCKVQDDFIFNSGGFIFSINTNTGNINWKVRL